MELTLIRLDSDAEGTSGVLRHGDQDLCYTLEPPWFNNQVNRSCIPAGQYQCRRVNSAKFGKVYQVKNVKNRTHILFHAGNFAGDKQRGLKAHSRGCILVGERHGKLHGQRAVLSSKLALKMLHALLNKQDFTLNIRYA